jgi:hypothetical protein
VLRISIGAGAVVRKTIPRLRPPRSGYRLSISSSPAYLPGGWLSAGCNALRSLEVVLSHFFCKPLKSHNYTSTPLGTIKISGVA